MEKNNNLRGQDKVLEICKKQGALSYYNAIGGRYLYSKEEFLNNGINLYFIKTENIEYNQFNNEFIPNLSIIDVMMFNSPENINVMLDQYQLV